MIKRMNHFYESKPDVRIEIPELNRDYMKFSAITFDSKKDLTAEHFEQVEAASIDAPEVSSREHGDYGPSLY